MAGRLLGLAAAAALTVPPLHAAAQTSPSRVVDPNRADQAPVAARGHAAPPSVQRKAAGSLKALRPFRLRDVRIEGSSVADEVLPAARGFVGQTVDGQVLEQITNAVAAAYARSDVALYTISVPAQDFTDGVLTLQVIEGRIERVVIKGKVAGRDMSLLRAYMRRLTAERPLRRRTLQRYVSLARDIPGLDTDINLVRGTGDGDVELDVDATPHPVQAGVGVNNRGAALLGHTQAEGDLYLNGLLRQGEQTHLTLAAPFQVSRFQYYAISHTEPLGADGASLQFSASHLRTRPSVIALAGAATSAGVQYSRPVLRTYADTLILSAGLDGLNSRNALFGQNISNERTRALRVAVTYGHDDAVSALSATGSVSQGLNALGARLLDPTASKLEFRKANARVIYNRQLGQTFFLRLHGAAQYTGDRLPASEQFALGGDEFGRGYEAAFVAGDKGLAGSAELAWRPAATPQRLAGSELYAFTDAGEVWTVDRLALPGRGYKIASAGVGGRATIDNKATFGLEAARGLTDPIPGLERKRWRLIASIKTLF